MAELRNTGATSPEENTSTTSAAQLKALLPAYVLGAADPEEVAFVHHHLADDAAAQEDLAAYEQLMEAMLYSARPVTPPPAMEGRLRLALAGSARPAAAQADASSPAHAPVAATPNAGGRAWHWPRLAWVAAAAAALLFVMNLWWIQQVGALHSENGVLRMQLTTQAATLATLQNRLETQEAMLSALRSQEASLQTALAGQTDLLAQVVATAGERYEMPAAQEDSHALATVAWLDQAGVGVLRASDFPTLPPDMAYQLWLIKDGERTSGGLFTVDAAGNGSLIFTPPGPLDDFDGMGVTPEPAGGSLGPTAPPVVTARLQHG